MKLGKIIKYFIYAIIFVIIGLFLFRVIVQSDESRLKTVTPNEVLLADYTADGTLNAQTHDILSVIDENGYFGMYAFVYFPDSKQLQVTVRYNISVYQNSDTPETAPIYFDLGYSTGGDHISPSTVETDSFWMYRYRRLVFDNVSADEATNIIIYMYDEKDGTLLTTQILRYGEQPFETRKLSKKELSAILPTK